MTATWLIGSTAVGAIGFGCMNLNHAYGQPVTLAQAHELIARAINCGYTHNRRGNQYGARQAL
jgi:hypothetical protein